MTSLLQSKALGEAGNGQLYTNQIAPTIAKILDSKIDTKLMLAKSMDLNDN